MRMRTHINTLIGQQLAWTHLVPEYEGSNRTFAHRGERTLNLHLTKIRCPGDNVIADRVLMHR